MFFREGFFPGDVLPEKLPCERSDSGVLFRVLIWARKRATKKYLNPGDFVEAPSERKGVPPPPPPPASAQSTSRKKHHKRRIVADQC